MQRYNTNTLKRNSGFTLLELIMVIVILGSLAATALPKFVNMGKGARIAAVNNLAGAITSAATIAFSACRLSDTTCPMLSYAWVPTLTANGKTYYFHWGYPTAWGDTSASQTGDIGDWLISYNGFTKNTYDFSYSVTFTRDDAPNPATCKVTYGFPNYGAKGDISVTPTTTGC